MNLQFFTLMLLVNFASTNWYEKAEKWPKPWHMGTHLRVLSESYQINTNMTGISMIFRKSLHPCALDESSLSNGRVSNWTYIKHINTVPIE